MSLHLWIRSETRATEQRAPLVPHDCHTLIADGVRVTVERSPQRVFTDDEYAAAGCELAAAGSWVDAPRDAHVLGIKELPDQPGELVHPHVYFAHAFKGQGGAVEVLDRFERGGGELLDIEYLTDEGRRVVAFGRWAGYVGAALGVLSLRGSLKAPLAPMSREELDEALAADLTPLNALVIGARGRSGSGAVEALAVAGAHITPWDKGHTTPAIDRAELLRHDLLVNCVVSHGPAVTPWVRSEDLAVARDLRMVADVTCDVTSDANLVPVNTAVTTWDEPVRRVWGQDGAGAVLDVIAIDNLPSLLPREASESFSAELSVLVTERADLAARSGPWAAARAAYDAVRAARGGAEGTGR
jgi:saccharopine dehydrogenase (NAD+, L-lysine-forming)